MSKSVLSRKQGDDYQALFFWVQACRLFEPHSKVKEVAYEYDEVKAFDDVVVYYDEPVEDERAEFIHADYYQVKYHVTQNDVITSDSLIDPAFIHASSISFLRRLQAAQQISKSQGEKCRFYLVTPWGIKHDDKLGEIVSNVDGEIRFDKLSKGSDGTKMGKIRKKWREHISLNTDGELYEILKPLRLKVNYLHKRDLINHLNDKLVLSGLKPIEVGRNTHPYIGLINSLMEKGQFRFNKEQLLDWCKREGLWIGNQTRSKSLEIRARSFHVLPSNKEELEIPTLCLTKYFNGRYLKDGYGWKSHILPKITHFISQHMKRGLSYNLHLDTHYSIAFALGYYLDSKTGIDVAPIQKFNGEQVWRPDHFLENNHYSDWIYSEIDCKTSGNDVAMIVGVRHDLIEDVTKYIEENQSSVGRIILCSLGSEPSATVVENGNHAWFLAERLTQRFRKERRSHLHIFYSGPSGLLFFVGQLAKGFGSATLYEYDFDRLILGGYTPSYSIPII